VNEKIHGFMYPGLEKDLGLGEITSICDNMHDRIASQDCEPPPRKPGPLTPLPEHTVHVVDTAVAVADMVDEILNGSNEDGPSTSIYLDLEGYELGREGTLCTVQIYNPPASKVYILDVDHLQEAAFSTTGSVHASINVKTLLEGDGFRKAFWDCRADSDALFSLHGIKLHTSTTEDLQLLELATCSKASDRRKVKPLSRAPERLNIPQDQLDPWKQTKEDGRIYAEYGPDLELGKNIQFCRGRIEYATANPKNEEAAQIAAEAKELLNGINYTWDASVAWEQRPFPPIMLKYAAGDVVLLPLLRAHYTGHERLTPTRKVDVEEETVKRIVESQQDNLPKRRKPNEAPSG
jgi:hypothetical protein